MRSRRSPSAPLSCALLIFGCAVPSTPVKPAEPTGEPTSRPSEPVVANLESEAQQASPASGDCPAKMAEIAAATFTMGANEGDFQIVAPVMMPRRSATVASRFCLDQTEVTVADYAACVAAGACTPAMQGLPCNAGAEDRDAHPINCVDADQAADYCASRGARLPTEEEWELAARGPDARIYPWGNADPRKDDALTYMSNVEGTFAVGQRPKADTPDGLKDMGGNVWEWTTSPGCMHDQPDCETKDRVIKGGGTTYFQSPAANRFFSTPATKKPDLGFRCAWPGAERRERSPVTGKRVALHWGELSPRDEITPEVPRGLAFGKRSRVICMTNVVIDGEGRPLSAQSELDEQCTRPFAAVAEKAAMRARWWPTFGRAGATSQIPIVIDRDPE